MRRLLNKTLLFLLCAPIGLSLPATAQRTISGQTTITLPGAWVLTDNVTVPCNGAPLIDIRVSGVTLDLQGFVLNCIDDSAPLIEAMDQTNLIVRNGQLEGGPGQIEPLIRFEPPVVGSFPQVPNSTYRFEGLRLREFKVAIDARGGGSRGSLEVRDCDLVSGRGEKGLLVSGFAVVEVRDTRIKLGRLFGVDGSPTPNFGGTAIRLESSDVVKIRDTAIFRANTAIYALGVEGGVIADNLLSWNRRGVLLNETRTVAVRDNVVSGGDLCFDGIALLDGSTENSIERNTILGYPMGIVLAEAGNHYSDNRVRSEVTPRIDYWDQTGGNVDGGRNVH